MDTSRLNHLKRHVFFEILETVGRVFMVVRHSEQVRIGNRGFLPEEKEHGLVLVINQRMNLSWTDGIIRCRLVFGQTPEDCIIPEGFVIGINSPEAQTQFLCLAETPIPEPAETEAGRGKEAPLKRKRKSKTGNVVTVDFRKKK